MLVMANGYCSQPKYRCMGNPDIGKMARKDRVFKWSNRTRRKVQAKACALHMATGGSYFITLTEPVNIESNEPISLFCNNLTKQGLLLDYVWVRERQKNGKNHYHVLFSSDSALFEASPENPTNFVNRGDVARVISDAWNSAMLSCGGKASKNSVRLGYKPVVANIGAVANYIGKYMSKGDRDTPETYRLHGSSRFEYCTSVSFEHVITDESVYLTYSTEYAHIVKSTVSASWWSKMRSYAEYEQSSAQQWYEELQLNYSNSTYKSIIYVNNDGSTWRAANTEAAIRLPIFNAGIYPGRYSQYECKFPARRWQNLGFFGQGTSHAGGSIRAQDL